VERTIEELDLRTLTDEHIATLNAFSNLMSAESRPEDPPTPVEVTTASLRNIPDFVDAKGYVIADDTGEWIAAAQAVSINTGDNPHALQVSIAVVADHRRQGIARRLLERVAAVAEQWDKTLLIGSTSERVQAGAAFATALGADAGLEAHVNRLLLAEVDRDMVQRWVEEGPARAPGYSLTGFDGRCPDDLIEDVVDVLHVMNDAPRDKLQLEDQRLTVDQFRAQEKMALASGQEAWWLFARHDSSGQLVGLTDVAWRPDQSDTVYQGNTGVRPEHRGHALGKWLKAAMLLRIFAERPDAVDIRTGNADSNDAMLGINRALGFKPFIANTAWQVSLDQVRTYLQRT